MRDDPDRTNLLDFLTELVWDETPLLRSISHGDARDEIPRHFRDPVHSNTVFDCLAENVKSFLSGDYTGIKTMLPPPPPSDSADDTQDDLTQLVVASSVTATRFNIDDADKPEVVEMSQFISS